LNDRSGALLIAPLGTTAVKRLSIDDGETPASLMRAALAAEPTLRQALEKPGLPQSEPGSPAFAARPVVSPFARFLPSFDLAPARTVADLIGASPLPASPLGGHGAD
jgi:tRNA(Ile)-lysidine synthase